MIKDLRSFLFIVAMTILSITDISALTIVQIRSDALIPANHRFRGVYGNYVSSFGLEASTDFWKDYDLWVNFDRVNKKGHLNGCGDSKLDLRTFSLGMKKVYVWNERFAGYLGLGLSISSIHIKNSLNDSWIHSKKTSVGGVLKSGVYVHVINNVVLDLFSDYYYQPVHYRYTTNCGGFRVGGGIGLAF